MLCKMPSNSISSLDSGGQSRTSLKESSLFNAENLEVENEWIGGLKIYG